MKICLKQKYELLTRKKYSDTNKIEFENSRNEVEENFLINHSWNRMKWYSLGRKECRPTNGALYQRLRDRVGISLTNGLNSSTSRSIIYLSFTSFFIYTPDIRACNPLLSSSFIVSSSIPRTLTRFTLLCCHSKRSWLNFLNLVVAYNKISKKFQIKTIYINVVTNRVLYREYPI